MKNTVLLITLLLTFFLVSLKAKSQTQYLIIYQDSKIAYSISLDNIDYMEIADKPYVDEIEKPIVEKRMKSLDKKSFVYTDGKITQQLWNGSVDYDIIYTESSIRIGEGIYYLNNGLITKQEYIGPYGYQEFTYENGRIKTWKKYSADGSLDEDISFEWKDGVIVRQTDIERMSDGHMELFCQYEYNYTENIDYGGAVAIFQSDSMFYDNLPEALIVQGYFGKCPKYLVSGAVDVSGYFSRDKSYTYRLDRDGYPFKISGSESATFTWENVK